MSSVDAGARTYEVRTYGCQMGVSLIYYSTGLTCAAEANIS